MEKRKILILIVMMIVIIIVLTIVFFISNEQRQTKITDFPITFTLKDDWEVVSQNIVDSDKSTQRYNLEITKKDFIMNIGIEDADIDNTMNITGGGFIRPTKTLSEEYVFVGQIEGRDIYRDAEPFLFNDLPPKQYGYYVELGENEITALIDVLTAGGPGDFLIVGIILPENYDEQDLSSILQEADQMILNFEN